MSKPASHRETETLLLSANWTESSLDVGDLIRFSGNYNPHVIVPLSADPLTSESTRAVKTLFIA